MPEESGKGDSVAAKRNATSVPTLVADMVAERVEDGMTLGLGSGRAATAFLHRLGERVRQGLRIRAAATSMVIEEIARDAGIPVLPLAELPHLDLAVDGADEVDPRLDLIKGLGGALVREKIVAASARTFYVLVGAEKLTPRLGSRGVLPVEVVPFGREFVRRRLARLGIDAAPRSDDRGETYRTDNGNHILDCRLAPLENPAELERTLLAIPGVVGTGLFLGMASAVFVEDGGKVRVLERSTDRAAGGCSLQ